MGFPRKILNCFLPFACQYHGELLIWSGGYLRAHCASEWVEEPFLAEAREPHRHSGENGCQANNIGLLYLFTLPKLCHTINLNDLFQTWLYTFVLVILCNGVGKGKAGLG